MWSAGCILYVLLCGYPPFYGDDNKEILDMVQKGVFDFDGEEWELVSAEAKDLIKKLITKPERRLSAQEALNHKWVKNHNRKKTDARVLAKLNISSMKRFQHSQKLKQVALMAIAVQSDPNEMLELK